MRVDRRVEPVEEEVADILVKQVQRIADCARQRPAIARDRACPPQRNDQHHHVEPGEDADDHGAVQTGLVIFFEFAKAWPGLENRHAPGCREDGQSGQRSALRPDQVAACAGDEIGRVVDDQQVAQVMQHQRRHRVNWQRAGDFERDTGQQPEDNEPLRLVDPANRQQHRHQGVKTDFDQQRPVGAVDRRDSRQAAQHRHVDHVLLERGRLRTAERERRRVSQRAARPKSRVQADDPRYAKIAQTRAGGGRHQHHEAADHKKQLDAEIAVFGGRRQQRIGHRRQPVRGVTTEGVVVKHYR